MAEFNQGQMRRMEDGRITQILNEIDALRREVRDALVSNGRMDERLIAIAAEQLNHSKEIRDLTQRVDRHERWINLATGKVSGISLAFGLLGGIVVWFVEHIVKR